MHAFFAFEGLGFPVTEKIPSKGRLGDLVDEERSMTILWNQRKLIGRTSLRTQSLKLGGEGPLAKTRVIIICHMVAGGLQLT